MTSNCIKSAHIGTIFLIGYVFVKSHVETILQLIVYLVLTLYNLIYSINARHNLNQLNSIKNIGVAIGISKLANAKYKCKMLNVCRLQDEQHSISTGKVLKISKSKTVYDV